MMERFVVGTGRCGSTMLTGLLSEHPDVLVMSEFFAPIDRDKMFSPEPQTGVQFADLVREMIFVIPILHNRTVMTKENLSDHEVYVPTLMLSTLPMATDDPWALHDEVLEAVEKFPTQLLKDHYVQLFEWLQQRLGRTFWIERSGPSAEWFPSLVDAYPDGKYVVLHRNGPETALSMMNHPHFQLWISLVNDPPTREEIEATEYGGAELDGTDTFSRRLSPDNLPPEAFAEWWSYGQVMSFKALAKLDKSQYIDVRFEDLVEKPEATLTRIADFFGLTEGGDWLDRAVARVKAPPTRFDKVSAEVQAALLKGCEIGEILLGDRPERGVTSTLQLMAEVEAKSK